MNFTYNSSKIQKALTKFKIQPDFDLALVYAEKLRDFYVYNTSALEGNTMTYPEVQTLLEGITVGGHKLSEEQQVLNQNESWSLLLNLVKEKKFNLNKETVCRLHAKVAKEEALVWGEFRNKMVGIGGTEHKPPKADELEGIFKELTEKIQKVENHLLRGLLYFLAGSLNQFFFDGNKRTSRLMLNGILLQNGFPVLNILAKDKLEFNTKMIEFYDTKDGTDLLEYLIGYYVEQNCDFGN